MASLINGIHHVTSCVAGAQEDIDFWTQIIGLRMIKQTVLFDGAASVYHLYYANGDAQPGSVMTTFPFKQAGLYGRTTYAGSEMTPIWGLSEGGYKTTGRNPIVKPVTVIYDPKLTLTLPPGMVVTSAMNSIAHCVEALYAENANPIASLMAEEGARALAQSIPIVIKQPGDLEARANAQYGC